MCIVLDVVAAASEDDEPAAADAEAAVAAAAAAAAGGDQQRCSGEAGPSLEHGGHHAAQRHPAALGQCT